jgi:hypothetical protein
LSFVAIGALALAQTFDYLTFLLMTARHGLGAEMNPFVVRIAMELGLTGLTLAKIVFVCFAALAAVVIARRQKRVGMTVLALGVVVGFIGGASNLATLWGGLWPLP